jgi:hypothetical protein
LKAACLAASAVVKGAVVSTPTGVAPFNGLAEQIAKVVVAGAGPGILDGGPATARTNRVRDMEGMAKSPPSMSRVQTMQLQLDPGTLGKVTPSGCGFRDRGSIFASRPNAPK